MYLIFHHFCHVHACIFVKLMLIISEMSVVLVKYVQVSNYECNGSELVFRKTTRQYTTPMYKYQSTYIQALPPLWDMPNYYYMYSPSSGSELIRPNRYIPPSFSGMKCGVETNQERASTLALSRPFRHLSILWAISSRPRWPARGIS